MKILRSMLYVPANSWRMITSAMSEGTDAVILDIEDGCPLAEKETARVFARDCIPAMKEHGIEAFVRINSLDTGLTALDISYVAVRGLDGVMLAKTESKEDIAVVEQLLKKEERAKKLPSGSISIIALLETPKGILNVQEIIAASPRVIAVSFGAGDYSREMGAGMGVTKISPDAYFPMVLTARSLIAMAARAAGIQAIDTPFFGFVIDLEGLVKEAEKVKLIGFSGKQLTHPSHVAPVNAVFSPPPEDVAFAKRLVAAYDAAKAQGLGATTMGGKMIDLGSFKRAQSLLAQAKLIEAKERLMAKD